MLNEVLSISLILVQILIFGVVKPTNALLVLNRCWSSPTYWSPGFSISSLWCCSSPTPGDSWCCVSSGAARGSSARAMEALSKWRATEEPCYWATLGRNGTHLCFGCLVVRAVRQLWSPVSLWRMYLPKKPPIECSELDWGSRATLTRVDLKVCLIQTSATPRTVTPWLCTVSSGLHCHPSTPPSLHLCFIDGSICTEMTGFSPALYKDKETCVCACACVAAVLHSLLRSCFFFRSFYPLNSSRMMMLMAVWKTCLGSRVRQREEEEKKQPYNGSRLHDRVFIFIHLE